MKRIALFVLLLSLGFVVGCDKPAAKPTITPAAPAKEGDAVTDPATTTDSAPDKEKPAEDMPEEEETK